LSVGERPSLSSGGREDGVPSRSVPEIRPGL
jgi:hypothetical protein